MPLTEEGTYKHIHIHTYPQTRQLSYRIDVLMAVTATPLSTLSLARKRDGTLRDEDLGTEKTAPPDPFGQRTCLTGCSSKLSRLKVDISLSNTDDPTRWFSK